MSLIIKKRPNPDQRVGSIKIRKLENENYQIEQTPDETNSQEDDSYNQYDSYQNNYQQEYYGTPQETFSDMYAAGSSYQHQQQPQENGDELVCTPSFDAFDSIIQSQEEDVAEDPFVNLPLEIKIESVSSLTPTLTQKPSVAAQFDMHYMSPDQSYDISKDGDVFMQSIYSSEDMPRGGTSASSITQMLRERNIRPLRHLAYIFADDGNRYFPCHCCSSAFIKKYLLIKHYGAKHKNVVACKLCASIFTEKMQHLYQQHMRAHNLRTSIQTKQCPLCLFWLSPRYYQGHLSIHNLLQKHFCRQCKQEFPSFYQRAKHICPMY